MGLFKLPNDLMHPSIVGSVNAISQDLQVTNVLDIDRILGIQFRTIYLVAVNCLFYPVDIARVQISAINFENGHVYLDRYKTRTPRVGILWPRTLEAIQRWLEVRPDSKNEDLVFHNTAGGKWTPDKVGENLRQHRTLAPELGHPIPDHVTFSTFRDGGYSAALLGPKVEEYTAKVLAGHNTGMLARYVLASPERLRPAVESIERHYFSRTCATE